MLFLTWVEQISPSELQSCCLVYVYFFMNCNKTFLTLTVTLNKAVRTLTGLQFSLLSVSSLLNKAATAAYFIISGKHNSINIRFTKLQIGGVRGADQIFSILLWISSTPVDILQSDFINSSYIWFAVTLVNGNEFPVGKAFLSYLVLISFKQGVILIIRGNGIIEPYSVSNSCKMIVEKYIRHFSWMINHIVILI